MSYEILRDDLGDEKSNHKKKERIKMGNEKNVITIKPMYIHIALILIIIGLLAMYFLKDVDFGSETLSKKELVTLIGDLKKFDENYSGNITASLSDFQLIIPTGKLDVKSSDLKISDFNGRIYELNDTVIVLEGVADEITYGSNEISLKGQTFKIMSTKKTKLDLEFETLFLEFETGRVKVDENFNYDFSNTNVTLSNSTMSFNFDGTYLLSGFTDSFVLNSNSPNLNIAYSAPVKAPVKKSK